MTLSYAELMINVLASVLIEGDMFVDMDYFEARINQAGNLS